MKKETITFTVQGKKVRMTGDSSAIAVILAAFVRGAVETYVDDQNVVGRSRDEIIAEMQRRVRIAEAHQKLGESDGFNCDLSDA